MAEMIDQRTKERSDYGPGNGFDAMGKPVPMWRRQLGYETCLEMGCDTEAAWSAVNGCAQALEKDRPYEAMQMACRYVDLTGAYRLIAVLCAAPKPHYKLTDEGLKRNEQESQSLS